MTAEKIVKALADLDEPLDNEYNICTLCAGDPETWDYSTRKAVPGTGHYPWCPWRMAKEYITRKES